MTPINAKEDNSESCPACGGPGIDSRQRYTRDREYTGLIECRLCGAELRFSGWWRLKWMLIINLPHIILLALLDRKSADDSVSSWWLAIPITALIAAMICYSISHRRAPLVEVKSRKGAA